MLWKIRRWCRMCCCCCRPCRFHLTSCSNSDLLVLGQSSRDDALDCWTWLVDSDYESLHWIVGLGRRNERNIGGRVLEKLMGVTPTGEKLTSKVLRSKMYDCVLIPLNVGKVLEQPPKTGGVTQYVKCQDGCQLLYRYLTGFPVFGCRFYAVIPRTFIFRTFIHPPHPCQPHHVRGGP